MEEFKIGYCNLKKTYEKFTYQTQQETIDPLKFVDLYNCECGGTNPGRIISDFKYRITESPLEKEIGEKDEFRI